MPPVQHLIDRFLNREVRVVQQQGVLRGFEWRGGAGLIPRIARFLAATYNGQAFQLDLFELRAVDIAISNDMLSCLDALRWGRADLYTLVPDGDARVRAVIDRWGLRWPADA